jgi:hypothetical protein
MNYKRVLPRDLFNEADLLKLCGKLWIALDDCGSPNAKFSEESVDSFDIAQDPGSGAIFLENISLIIRGEAYRLERPLNARAPWCLYACRLDEECQVFTEDGKLSRDFMRLAFKYN